MFRKKCSGCSRKINKDFDFCPYCGKSIESESYGMLGKNDSIKMQNQFGNMFGNSMFNKMFLNMIKILEKQLAKKRSSFEKEEFLNMPKFGFELYINGEKMDLEDDFSKTTKQETIKKISSPSQEVLQKAIKLPRKEAKTELKRLSNKIIYELKVPGINSLDRILVTKLEDSIEVKAFADNCVYIKTIPIKLLLTKYYLKNESLFLEFQSK